MRVSSAPAQVAGLCGAPCLGLSGVFAPCAAWIVTLSLAKSGDAVITAIV